MFIAVDATNFSTVLRLNPKFDQTNNGANMIVQVCLPI